MEWYKCVFYEIHLWSSLTWHELSALLLIQSKKFCDFVDKQTGYKTKCMLTFPLIAEKECLGVVTALNKIGAPAFTAEDEKVGRHTSTCIRWFPQWFTKPAGLGLCFAHLVDTDCLNIHCFNLKKFVFWLLWNVTFPKREKWSWGAFSIIRVTSKVSDLYISRQHRQNILRLKHWLHFESVPWHFRYFSFYILSLLQNNWHLQNDGIYCLNPSLNGLVKFNGNWICLQGPMK